MAGVVLGVAWTGAPRHARAQAEIGEPIQVGDDSSKSRHGSSHAHARSRHDEDDEDSDSNTEADDAGSDNDEAAVAPSKSKKKAKEAEAAEPPPPPPAPVVVVQSPAEAQAALLQSWQARLDRLAAGDTKKASSELDAMLVARKTLGLENLMGPSTALIVEAEKEMQHGRGAEAVTRCEEAAKLSPGFDIPQYCLARATLAKDFFSIGTAFAAIQKGMQLTWNDVRAHRNAVTSTLLMVLFGFALACAVLIVLLVIRHAQLALHDFHHLFPKAVPAWQTTLVALVLLGLPALFGMGILGSLALAAIAVSTVARRSEVVVMALAFALVATAQYEADAVLRSGSFGRLAQDVYLLERGDAPAPAAKAIEERADGGLGEYVTAYALGHYYKRMGRLDDAAHAYEAAKKFSETGDLLNNMGNVQALSGKIADAKATYQKASTVDSRLAAPLWNIGDLYIRETNAEKGEEAHRRARELDPERAQAMLENAQEDSRGRLDLLDIPLSNETISNLADREAATVLGTGGATFDLLTGNLREYSVVLLSVLTALLLIAVHFASLRFRVPSSRCERCGRSVCPRCDPDVSQTSGMCSQCISVFVRKTGVDPSDRIIKEIEVRRFRRRRLFSTRLAGILVSGGGHILAGHVVTGVIFLLMFSLLLSRAMFWNGVLRSPVPVQMSTSVLQVGLLAAAYLVLVAVSLRHLARVDEAD